MPWRSRHAGVQPPYAFPLPIQPHTTLDDLTPILYGKDCGSCQFSHHSLPGGRVLVWPPCAILHLFLSPEHRTRHSLAISMLVDSLSPANLCSTAPSVPHQSSRGLYLAFIASTFHRSSNHLRDSRTITISIVVGTSCPFRIRLIASARWVVS